MFDLQKLSVINSQSFKITNFEYWTVAFELNILPISGRGIHFIDHIHKENIGQSKRYIKL